MPIKPAGRRIHSIQFQRLAASEDALGGTDGSNWTDLFSSRRPAAIYFGTGAERREAAAEKATLVATFNVLADSCTRTVTAADRIEYGGSTWDITSVTPIGGVVPTELDFTATASKG
jgi:head-tail adaptor